MFTRTTLPNSEKSRQFLLGGGRADISNKNICHAVLPFFAAFRFASRAATAAREAFLARAMVAPSWESYWASLTFEIR